MYYSTLGRKPQMHPVLGPASSFGYNCTSTKCQSISKQRFGGCRTGAYTMVIISANVASLQLKTAVNGTQPGQRWCIRYFGTKNRSDEVNIKWDTEANKACVCRTIRLATLVVCFLHYQK